MKIKSYEKLCHLNEPFRLIFIKQKSTFAYCKAFSSILTQGLYMLKSLKDTSMHSLFVLEKPFFSENKIQLFSLRSNLVTMVPNYSIHRGRMTFKNMFISFLLMNINVTLEFKNSLLLSENCLGTPVSTDYYEGNMKEKKRSTVREKHGGRLNGIELIYSLRKSQTSLHRGKA